MTEMKGTTAAFTAAAVECVTHWPRPRVPPSLLLLPVPVLAPSAVNGGATLSAAAANDASRTARDS